MTEPNAEALEYDWGGDGSDLHNTMRAHVEGALVPTTEPYAPPFDELLRLGDPRERANIDARIAAASRKANQKRKRR